MRRLLTRTRHALADLGAALRPTTDTEGTTMTDTATPTRTILELDPQQLVIAANVRSDVGLDKPFLDSVRQHGILVPISAWWDDVANAWQVLDGQRRTLAARETGLTTVPVWTVPKVAGEDERIIGQLTVNDHRKALHDREEATALNDLALFGLSADSIRKKTNIAKARVNQALTVASTPAAAQLLTEQPITLEHAAALAAFADDAETMTRLTDVAVHNPSRLDWDLRQAEQDRDRRQAIRDKRAELEEAGVTVLNEWPDTAPGKACHLDRLDTADGQPVPEEESRPHAAAWVQAYTPDNVHVSWYVLNPAAHSWHDRYATSTSATRGAELTKEEKRAIRERATDWKTATSLRIDRLRAIVSNRIAPRFHPAAHALIAAHLAGRISTGMGEKSIAAAWLGIPAFDGDDRYNHSDYWGLGAYLDTHPDRTLNVALALVLVDAETVLSRAGLGKPHETVIPTYARYLQLLTALGHVLTPIEERAAGTISAVTEEVSA